MIIYKELITFGNTVSHWPVISKLTAFLSTSVVQ